MFKFFKVIWLNTILLEKTEKMTITLRLIIILIFKTLLVDFANIHNTPDKQAKKVIHSTQNTIGKRAKKIKIRVQILGGGAPVTFLLNGSVSYTVALFVILPI